ncbi:hypothetical protein [Lacrimispora xylanolytica]|uniref:Uncharacterized protein n=1 Tax=Lacrimispora xylanolytica TaxID=29375 RepID=A0ABY7ACF5_9FIRM|nr:hypothetical protein [Lacrimispora xylanolytica]WAJ23549.1 hypothetical protein OW255_18610 [Lacrimispora xylanolytica]
MNITAEKVKEAGYWCKKILELNQQYLTCENGIKRQKRISHKIGQVIVRWLPSMFMIFIIVFGIFIYRLIQAYPIEPPNPNAVLLNEFAIPVYRYFLILSIIDFPISLFWGLSSVSRNLKQLILNSNELKKQLDIVIKEKIEIISIIPEKYRYPLSTDFLADVLICGRADTMKEALNLYEEQIHRWNVESKMDAVLKRQQSNNNLLWAHVVADILFR